MFFALNRLSVAKEIEKDPSGFMERGECLSCSNSWPHEACSCCCHEIIGEIEARESDSYLGICRQIANRKSR